MDALDAGARAEHSVMTALQSLPAPAVAFSSWEWRHTTAHGESIGEADALVFDPSHGLIVLEIKAGQVHARDGRWFYGSGLEMKASPFQQARRNRYALVDKLSIRLGAEAARNLSITHAVWFPDLHWKAPLPGEVPSRSFILDRSDLKDPEPGLRRILREAFGEPRPWTLHQQKVLRDLVAPTVDLLVPLGTHVDAAVSSLHRATTRQIHTLRLLRSQKRLLVEGGAGSGKTLLAATLAREHAALGRKVLFTCFNKALATHLSASLADAEGVTVRTFHEWVRQCAATAGLPFEVPADAEARRRFFADDCADLLLSAAEACPDERYDTLIVDEAADFLSMWWVGMEAMLAPQGAWYCFYDRHQSVYRSGSEWEPPFAAEPMVLDTNLRNTRPVGELAARLGQCRVPAEFRVDAGPAPVLQHSADFGAMAEQLRKLLRTLIRQDDVRAEQIVVLSPYRHDRPESTWVAGLDEVQVSTDVAVARLGQVRVGTLQGFKGLEADVVILAGLTPSAVKHPDWLYVGASRARAMLYLLALDGVNVELDTLAASV